MAHLDFRLRHLLWEGAPSAEQVHVLLQFKDCPPSQAEVGLRVTTVAGDVAAGSIPRDKLNALRLHPQVVLVEGSRQLKDETDVSLLAINLLEPERLQRTVPGDGRGAIIGVIDSGFDLTHPCFRNTRRTATRVLCAWDQADLADVRSQPPSPGVTTPSPFDYGVEYTDQRIDRLIADRKVLVISSQDETWGGMHGTYVAGVAAGNGAHDLVYKGVAPQAELILVAYKNDVPIGGSAFVLDAISYIKERARRFRKPVVINLSQGDNLGAHDGTSLLERAIDHLIEHENLLVVNSAGNEGFGYHHAQGRVAQGQEVAVPFTLPESAQGDVIDLWYGQADRFALAVKPPGGERSRFVAPDETDDPAILRFGDGDDAPKAYIYSDLNYPNNGENRITVVLAEHDGWKAGEWKLVLRGDRVSSGDFDAWADRPGGITSLQFGQPALLSTVTIPGTARQILTVGGFVARAIEFVQGGAVRGELSIGSSIGPTRDGRRKPDLTAPSHLVMAPRMRLAVEDFPSYDPLMGTSLAAPHVAGVAALLWGLEPALPAAQLRAILLSTACPDSFTGGVPNSTWGNGKLDARAAHQALTPRTANGGTAVSQQSMELNLKLPNETGDQVTPVTVRFDSDEEGRVNVRAFGAPSGVAASGESAAAGKAYRVTFVIHSSNHPRGCWLRLEPPAPPARFVWVNPCPVAIETEIPAARPEPLAGSAEPPRVNLNTQTEDKEETI